MPNRVPRPDSSRSNPDYTLHSEEPQNPTDSMDHGSGRQENLPEKSCNSTAAGSWLTLSDNATRSSL